MAPSDHPIRGRWRLRPRYWSWIVMSATIACSSEPESVAEAFYVGSTACVECHRQQHDLWSGSHHDRAMEVPDETTVLGDFDDAVFVSFGDTTSFFRRDGGYFVRTRGRDGELADFAVAYTFGLDPLQQYLIAFPGGRFQALGVAWDSRPSAEGGQRWYHLYPDEPIPPSDVLHWTRHSQNWNVRCAECHSTHLEKNYDVASATYSTTWSEIDVGCEACHGPASNHIEAARAGRMSPLALAGTDGTSAAWAFSAGQSIASRSAPLATRAEVETCASCHSRRSVLRESPAPGTAFLDAYRPVLLEEGLYHPDGQIQDEVYVYGSFVQSRMYAAGVTCTDCHDPHTARVRADGNALCGQCHSPSVFDTPAHHFHVPASPGARCVECHMPSTTYMGVDDRRDHGFRVPRPDLSAKIGTPDACTACHVDQSAEWAATAVRDQLGDPERPTHFGEIFALARGRDPSAVPGLVEVMRDSSELAIVRATAASLLSGFSSRTAASSIRAALLDAEPLVRLAAVQGSRTLAPSERALALEGLLEDSVRAVRIDAARVMAEVPPQSLTELQRNALEPALRGYMTAQLANRDSPQGQANLGLLYSLQQRQTEAIEAYRAAMAIDSMFVPSYVNLAELHRLLGDDSGEERVLGRALELVPDAAVVRYANGLMLVRRDRLDEALEELEQAASLEPQSPQFAYAYALAVAETGEAETAITLLRESLLSNPFDPLLLEALATMSRDQGRRGDALSYALRLAEVRPDDAGVQALVAELGPPG